MLIFLAILFLILLWGSKGLKYNEDYIARAETDSWKGFFIVLILFSHALSYVEPVHFLDTSFSYVVRAIGQMMVVMFLFYSGYGIMESYSHKEGYARSFYRRRILPVFLHFEIAVLVFAVLQLVLGTEFPMRNWILCWTGWENIGNSNWFMFDIFAVYLFSLAGFGVAALARKLKACGNDRVVAFVVTALLTLCLWALFRYGFPDKGSRWYNTIWTFPLGMAYSLSKERLESVIAGGRGKAFNSSIALVVAFVLFCACSGAGGAGLIFNFKSCFFALAIVFASMKLKIGNPVLVWLGRNCFSIYIFQRLPMILLKEAGLNASHPFGFMALSVLLSLLIAWGFSYVFNALDHYVLKVK